MNASIGSGWYRMRGYLMFQVHNPHEHAAQPTQACVTSGLLDQYTFAYPTQLTSCCPMRFHLNPIFTYGLWLLETYFVPM